MLSETGRKHFDGPAWINEMKWDGFRILAFVQEGTVELLSRNLHPFKTLFRPIADSLRTFRAPMIL
jgi:bifunctional non-homologous end joining protein LigD